MIDSLRGELLEKAPGHAVVEVGGVGYLVHIPLTVFTELPDRGPVRLFIHYAVSVDVRSGQSDHRLYGFRDGEERALFRQLITVQGVSTTVGLSLMSAKDAGDLRLAILNGDELALKSVKGIGPKLAQRIVQELRGRLTSEPNVHVSAQAGTGNSLKAEALSALTSLGLDRMKAERAVQGILNERKAGPPTLEELIRLSLKNL